MLRYSFSGLSFAMCAALLSFPSAARAETLLSELKTDCGLYLKMAAKTPGVDFAGVVKGANCITYVSATFDALLLDGDVDPARPSICPPSRSLTEKDVDAIALEIVASEARFTGHRESLNSLPEAQTVLKGAAMTARGAVLMRWPCPKKGP